MPIFNVFFVVLVLVAAIWAIQRFIQEPARSILIGGVALFLVWYLFHVFGLLDVKV